ncbi:MAG TPA: hypothetical protein DCW31_03490 [Lactobacillus sp.]|nr:hypothetical protein [Lactobacillus sp.]
MKHLLNTAVQRLSEVSQEQNAVKAILSGVFGHLELQDEFRDLGLGSKSRLQTELRAEAGPRAWRS